MHLLLNQLKLYNLMTYVLNWGFSIAEEKVDSELTENNR